MAGEKLLVKLQVASESSEALNADGTHGSLCL